MLGNVFGGLVSGSQNHDRLQRLSIVVAAIYFVNGTVLYNYRVRFWAIIHSRWFGFGSYWLLFLFVRFGVAALLVLVGLG